MRRLLYYSLLCLLWISVDSCKDDEVAAPPKPSFSVDKTSGLYNATEFTFTIDQVEGNSISLLPYGVENPSFGGISVPASSFTNGKATVKFTYAKIGTYNAVVVANNHSTDGNSIKNVYSDPRAITITSDATKMTEFTIDKATKSEFKNKVATDIDTFLVTMPYGSDGKATDITKLKGKFTVSDFSSVFIGTTAQTSGTTENNYSAPVTYTVKSQDAAQSKNYLVIVTVTPIETANTFKSINAIATSKSAANKVLQVSIDNAGRILVVYDVQGSPAEQFDSLSLDYALTGSFAYAKYNGATKKMKAKDTVNLLSPKTIKVIPQDSVVTGPATYDVYATSRVPKLSLAFNTLLPPVAGSNSGFAITLNVLTGTDVDAIPTTADWLTDLPTGVIVSAVMITEGDAAPRAFVPGGLVDYSKPVKFELTVTDSQLGGGITYKVYYTATVKVLK
jgi:hypothetical protein